MNRYSRAEAVREGFPGNQREVARMLSPIAIGVFLALAVLLLWMVFMNGIIQDAGMERARQLHLCAGLYERAARGDDRFSAPVFPGDSGESFRFELPSQVHEALGLSSASITVSRRAGTLPEEEVFPDGMKDHSGTFIVRYDASRGNATSVFTYEDKLWNTRVKNFEYLRNSIIITIIIVVIIVFGPVTVQLLSMFRRNEQTREFASSHSSSPGIDLHGSSMRTVIEESVLPSALIDSQGLITDMSGTAISLLGLDGETMPVSLSSVVSLPASYRKSCLEGRTPIRETVGIVSSSGGSEKAEAVFQPVFRSGEYAGAALFLLPERTPGKPPEPSEINGSNRQDQEVLTGMVRGLAHDLNNRVAGIVGAASLGLREASVDWELAGRFRDILREAGKLSDVCSELQLLLVSGESESGVCDPSHELARISQVLRSVMPFNISVETGGASRYRIIADRGLLRQFFFSLALASSELMKGGSGKIRINLSDRLPRQILSTDAGTVYGTCFRYSDGFIMAPEIRDVFSAREYDPADVDRRFGTAYGTAYRSSLEFGGWIGFERGMGETILCLVLKGVRTQDGDAPGEEAPSEDSDLRVLLADDVDLVRETLGEFLKAQGFMVVTSADGDQVMDQLSRGEFDVMVLDLNMPGAPSISIAAHCLSTFPQMAVILSSGYDRPDGIDTLLANERVVFIPKPSPPVELVRQIHSLVGRIRAGKG